jgi:hypothetical protein
VVIIGIDPHKSSLTAVAVDRSGTTVASRRFVVNAGTAAALGTWSQQWPERRYAIEGAKEPRASPGVSPKYWSLVSTTSSTFRPPWP